MTRSLATGILWSLILLLYWPVVSVVVGLALHDDRYLQIAVGPLICAFLIYWERRQIFARVEWDPFTGIPLFALALSLYFFYLRRPSYSGDDGRLCLAVFAVMVACAAAFILCYGRRSFQSAAFPFCCLLLAIPVPASFMDKITSALQHGSAATSYRIFRLIGVPVFAQDMRISVPGLEIEVAPECSGIRSCLALAMAGLVVGRIFLRKGWTRLALVASTIPIAILKNGIRICVIVWLSAYVDRGFLYGPVHHYGGIVFTPLGVGLFWAVFTGLRRLELKRTSPDQAAQPIPEAVL